MIINVKNNNTTFDDSEKSGDIDGENGLTQQITSATKTCMAETSMSKWTSLWK